MFILWEPKQTSNSNFYLINSILKYVYLILIFIFEAHILFYKPANTYTNDPFYLYNELNQLVHIVTGRREYSQHLINSHSPKNGGKETLKMTLGNIHCICWGTVSKKNEKINVVMSFARIESIEVWVLNVKLKSKFERLEVQFSSYFLGVSILMFSILNIFLATMHR